VKVGSKVARSTARDCQVNGKAMPDNPELALGRVPQKPAERLPGATQTRIITEPTRFTRVLPLSSVPLLNDQLLHLLGALFEEAIASRVLQARRQSALSF
jgi:hypothetical protein